MKKILEQLNGLLKRLEDKKKIRKKILKKKILDKLNTGVSYRKNLGNDV